MTDSGPDSRLSAENARFLRIVRYFLRTPVSGSVSGTADGGRPNAAPEDDAAGDSDPG